MKAACLARGATALLYHKIDYLKRGVLRRGLYVSPQIFETHLRALQRAGLRSKSAEEAAFGDRQSTLITFDDGFRDNLTHALPLLRAAGFSAINFLITGRIGGVNAWDLPEGERSAPLMDETQVREWIAGGLEIGAHTLTHPHLTRLSLTDAREEITASKLLLEDRFAQPVHDFAYPYGEFNPAIKDLVAAAGFRRAWTTKPGILGPDCDPLALPRLAVSVSLRHPVNLWRSLAPLGRINPHSLR